MALRGYLDAVAERHSADPDRLYRELEEYLRTESLIRGGGWDLNLATAAAPIRLQLARPSDRVFRCRRCSTVHLNPSAGVCINHFCNASELEEQGVVVHEWSDTMLDAFRGAWDDVVAERSAEDETFARVWQHISDFRAQYDRWGSLGYLD